MELSKRAASKRQINEILAPQVFQDKRPVPKSLYAMLDKSLIPPRYRRDSVVADKHKGRTSKSMPELHFSNLGKDLHVHPSHISSVFDGTKRPSLSLLYRITQIFQLELSLAARVVDPTGTVAVAASHLGITQAPRVQRSSKPQKQS